MSTVDAISTQTTRIDFDISGFLWVLSNAGRLAALVFFIGFIGLAITYWIRVIVHC